VPDYFDQGFCVRRPSWHSKESILQEFPDDWSMARELAGLDWEPATQVPYQVRRIAVGHQERLEAIEIKADASGADALCSARPPVSFRAHEDSPPRLRTPTRTQRPLRAPASTYPCHASRHEIGTRRSYARAAAAASRL